MFAAQHDNPPSLRQGDIIANVFFPLARPASLKFLGTYASGSGTNIVLEPFVETPQGSRKQYLQVISHGVVAHGAVLSQCCDLDTKHPKSSFSLCRLIAFERNRYKHVDALIGNIDPWGSENVHYQFFYVGKIDGLEGEYLADFALLTSCGWTDYEFILRKKVHQLDNLNRNKFRVKLGAFFGRPTDDDVKAGLGNPYEPTSPTSASLFTRIRSFLHI
jgi:hypothetical protein